MTKITEKIKNIPNLFTSPGASAVEIKQAEDKLGLAFSQEFKEYLEAYGQISFKNTEWMGLNSDDFCDVVLMTVEARQTYSDFPLDKYIVEDLHFDDNLILSDCDGKIYHWHSAKEEILYSSLIDYLEECLARE